MSAVLVWITTSAQTTATRFRSFYDSPRPSLLFVFFFGRETQTVTPNGRAAHVMMRWTLAAASLGASALCS